MAAIIPFTDEADAVRIANDTPYGLSGSIWTTNGARALRVARALGVLDMMVSALDPYATDWGRLRSQEALPERVRPRRTGQAP